MSINRSILSEFIKATNDNKETKQTQLYGTVVTQGNSKCVKIDGSEIVTPVRSITDIKDEERVMVSIKDHMATVTGNMTNPSVGNDRVESAEGKIDRFDHLFAGNITAENIAADSITADKILAGSITTDKLMAESIIADKIAANAIESKHIKADTIESSHIKANTIESDHIKANTIESDHIQSNTINSNHINSNTINSDHIVAGSITSENIATGTITAGSGIIAEGAIGSAQISSLDVAKLESGTIDTSKIYIAGADGHLQLKGNRLQVFDGLGNRAVERVSVGDVNGDGSKFGLRVRGADGETILLDENGVTSEGITDGSITNNKISDDANIDGAKLNINSVVSKINEDGTEVIKGTKISVNGTNLESKLYTIESTQSSQGDTITQNTSKITANEKAIALKVDTQTYTTDKENMTSQLTKNTSSIEALQNEISLKVESTDITNAINNIQVGGRNFILNSNFIFGVEYWSHLDGVIDYQNKKCAYQTMNATSGETFIMSNRMYNEQISGKTITLSFLAACTPNMRSFEVYILSKKTDSDKDWDYAPVKQFVLNEKLTKYTWTYTMPSDIESFYIRFDNNSSTDGQNATLYITDVKFEIGNKATDWTPAPEDITSEIDAKIYTAKSEIKITTDAITQNVSNLTQTVSTKADGSTVSSLNSKVSSLETSVNGISGKVTSLEKTTTTLGTQVDAANTNASSALNKANSATTTANNAQNTANTNKNNITDLQGEVSTVKSNVASLEVTTSGISQKVSSVESTTATISGKVNTANNNATNALNKANSANTLADSKAKVFTSTPTVPYKVGDLWVQGTNGDVMKCKTARASGSYTSSDWEKASKYTDDTKANAVDGKVTTLQGTVNTTNSKVATLETNLNGITQRVSSTESTTATLTTKVNNAQNTADNVNNKLNNLSIGGRNYIKDSKSVYMKPNGTSNYDLTFSICDSFWKNENRFGTVILSFDVEPDEELSADFSSNVWFRAEPWYSFPSWTYPKRTKEKKHYTLQASLKNAETTYKTTQLFVRFQTKDTIGMTFTNVKLEISTKPSDWTPAPEDIDSSISAVDSKVESTKSKVATIETNLSGITSRVSNVETNQTTTNGKVSSLETRMSTAESKITETAITNVVKESQLIKDMNGNITVNKNNISKIEQTSNSITSSVKDLEGKYTEIKQTVDGIDLTGKVSFSDLSTSGRTTINGANITTGTIDTNRVNIKGSTTRKIVIANDNYCVYDGAETDVNRKVFMGFRPYNSNAQYIPSVMLGYNGINPNVDGAVVSGGTYTTYSHYPNNNNPESINQSYGALAFKYGASGTQFSTLNMYQNGDIDLKAGSGIYFRPSLRNKNNHVFGMTDTEVGCRVPFKCTSTIFTNGDITTDRNIHAYGNISASGSMSCGTILPSNISIGSGLSINSNGIYTSGHITGNMVKTDSYRFTNNHTAFGKNEYNNNMMNGCHWDWQYHNLVNVKVYPVSLSLPTIDEPTVQTVSETQSDTLSQIKFPDIKVLSTEDSAPPIDISNVTNKEEITTNGDVDLIKLVYLLVKDVQELKQENDELRKMIKEL